MSIWTSKLLTVCVLVLAACVAPLSGGGSSAVKVLGGAMTAAVPAGYCIDPKASHANGGSAVIIAGRCSADRPVPAAVVTISIGGEGSAAILKTGAKALSDWARSPAGRAALARDGRASSVMVRETMLWDGAFLIRLQDRKIGPYWRAALGLKGRLVMISVSPPVQAGLPLSDGRGILERAITVMRRANASNP